MEPAPTGLVDPSIVASMFSDKEKARGTIRLKKPKPKVINPGSLKESELVGMRVCHDTSSVRLRLTIVLHHCY